MRTRAPLTGLLASIVLGLITAVPGGPARIDAAFAAAPEGRLVVTWRQEAPAALADGDVRAVARSKVNVHRSVVVSKGGRTAAVAARLQADPRVASVVPDAVGRATDWPSDPNSVPTDAVFLPLQEDMRDIGMPSAWSMTSSPSSTPATNGPTRISRPCR